MRVKYEGPTTSTGTGTPIVDACLESRKEVHQHRIKLHADSRTRGRSWHVLS